MWHVLPGIQKIFTWHQCFHAINSSPYTCKHKLTQHVHPVGVLQVRLHHGHSRHVRPDQHPTGLHPVGSLALLKGGANNVVRKHVSHQVQNFLHRAHVRRPIVIATADVQSGLDGRIARMDDDHQDHAQLEKNNKIKNFLNSLRFSKKTKFLVTIFEYSIPIYSQTLRLTFYNK